jgi:pimeloyl-ACP methyl ester carboxylesterase
LPALKAAGHAVLALDQHGYGQSNKGFARNTIMLGAENVLAVLKVDGLSGCVVYSWSLGDATATVGAMQTDRTEFFDMLTTGVFFRP